MNRLNQELVVIRADGGNQLGMGHIMRTSVLAQELVKYFKVVYLCDERYIQGIAFLEGLGYLVDKASADAIVGRIQELSPDILITDHYGSDMFYMSAVKQYAKYTIYIDDNAEKAFEADMIINQNAHAPALRYLVGGNETCKYLLGTQYLLMRENFRDIVFTKLKREVNDILITVGGSDPHNLTGLILKEVGDLPYTFHVVIGGGFPHFESLQKTYESFTNIHFYIQPSMKELMQKVDVAISSCGSTLYELGVVGVPTIGIVIATNQLQLANKLLKEGLIVGIGERLPIQEVALREKIHVLAENILLREQLQAKCNQAFDANGVYHIVEEIMKWKESR